MSGGADAAKGPRLSDGRKTRPPEEGRVGGLERLAANLMQDDDPVIDRLLADLAESWRHRERLHRDLAAMERDRLALEADLQSARVQVEAALALSREGELIAAARDDAIRRERELTEASCSHLLAQAEQRVAQARCEADGAEARERELVRLLAEQRSFVNYVTGSRSWRLTAPMRAVLRFAKALRRRMGLQRGRPDA